MQNLTHDEIELFETICRAARNGDLALVSTRDTATGEHRAVICVVKPDPLFDYTFVWPLGNIAYGDPVEVYDNPAEDCPEYDEAVDRGLVVEQRKIEADEQGKALAA